MTLKPNSTNTEEPTGRIEHERLTSLINSMADAVIALDENAKVVLYNASALNILDVNTIRIGSSLANLFKPVDKEKQPVDIVAMVRQTKVPVTNRDLRLQYGDDSLINLYVSIAPVHLGYGEKGDRGFVLLLRDITREKSLEEERDEFISVVSHELRTPIAISEGNISNALFVAQKTGDIAQITKALEEAHNQVLFLADMINDLSTLSRAERGKLDVEVEAINVHDLVKELENNYRPQAEAKGLTLKISIDPSLELLSSSKLYVREILQNFITNAIKYTEKGSVSLDAKPDSKGVLFAVHDTGIGISKADQERVYDKFFRSEDFRTRQANGTGLGLYVTVKLARLVHADIELDSELNKGSTFKVHIPNLAKP
jgi:two-component system phosphate regulon sensor histidine kinase PhoR